MKVLIKGGIWKNTEDEILKAAVSKYGKNQWARISSLLVRKTPKQCKARWYEWLDPSIKKTEWSKEEDEKLLHLAKLMPTQWRTIAPIVGRTPAQCLERYQRLLDEAEAKEAGGELGLQGAMGGEGAPSADDVRRLRPGEVDPEPETKPARPDPIDMDEDEKEMLSEARARLANTQGKKAKRKARERQLEEARRLASLQKRRELKAAGIHIRLKRKKNDMDYNADIPFEKPVPLGFYDITEEKNRPVDPGKLTNVHLSKLNRRRADIEEEKQREKKRKEREQGKKGNEPEGNQGRFVLAKDSKLIKAQEQEQIAKRRKLVLPAPQIGEEELEGIVKAGFVSENARSLVQDEEGGTTSGLVDEYSATPKTLPVRTPRAPPSADTLTMEARNLRALNSAQTPLLGEENTPLHMSQGTGFEGITPRASEIQTPNPLLTPRTEPGIGATPRRQISKLQAKRELLQGLASLPMPRNEYEIRLPELDEQAEKDAKADKQVIVEDMNDVEKRNAELAKQEEQERFARQSLAVQRNLPRPTTVPASLKQDNLSEVEAMIQEEYLRLLKHDMVKHPVVGGKVAPGAASLGDLGELDEEFTSRELQDAREEFDKELRDMLGLDEDADVKEAIWKHVSSNEEYEDAWNREHDELYFSSKLNQFMSLPEIPDDKDKTQGFSKILEANRRAMVRDYSQTNKLIKKLDIRLGGYMARSAALQQQILDAFEELEGAKIEYESFMNLQINEKGAISRRVDALQQEVDNLARRERELQLRYKDLLDMKSDYLASIEALQQS